MNRRESLKAIGISTISTSLLLNACKPGATVPEAKTLGDGLDDTEKIGLEEFEKERLKKIKKEGAFFNEHERLTIIALADIIIPKDEISGSASDAKVIDFIDFIVKDIPENQLPLRGGLKWLDMQCLNRYEHSFLGSSAGQQLEIVKEIAYPAKAKPEMQQGVVFFTRLRSLVGTGFYTSEIGIKDLGYVGNVPGRWEGVPADVLKQYNLTDA